MPNHTITSSNTDADYRGSLSRLRRPLGSAQSQLSQRRTWIFEFAPIIGSYLPIRSPMLSHFLSRIPFSTWFRVKSHVRSSLLIQKQNNTKGFLVITLIPPLIIPYQLIEQIKERLIDWMTNLITPKLWSRYIAILLLILLYQRILGWLGPWKR